MTLGGFIIPLAIVFSFTFESFNEVKINRFLFRHLLVHSIISLPSPVTLCHPVDNNCLYFPIQKFLYPNTVTRSHKRYRRQFLMYPNFMNRASDAGTNLTQPLLYRKLDEDKYKYNIKQINQTHTFNENSSNIFRDVRSSALRMQQLNGALSKKKHVLQYINNPSIYAIFTKPVQQYTIPYPTTKVTYLPNTMAPSSYINSQIVTTSKPITASQQYVQWTTNMYNNYDVMAKFLQSLDQFERKFYKVTFRKLSSISAVGRRENGISFVQSGLFLQLVLLALSSQVNDDVGHEIEECIDLNLTHTEKMYVIRQIVSSLPISNDALKFRLSTRIVLSDRQRVTSLFQHGLANALKLHIDRIDTTDTVEELTAQLNKMIEKDSGGAMRDTFEEDELSEGICSILITAMYIRPRWRAAPTVLNGTHLFFDADDTPSRFMRMIRINDIMRYAELNEWDAQAIEIFYATPGLSLLMIVPRGRSLRKLSSYLAETSIHRVVEKMYSVRVAVSLPLYTLRMTLLLPSKLQSMGIRQLVDIGNEQCEEVRLSHAVQRLMFWSEAGRNAFKDDGIEWDEVPELELVVNRPYIFFVRWRNITIMNGNFVL